VQVTSSITGLVFGTIHGFHIHQYGDLTAPDGTSTGSHYNPLNEPHGLPPNDTRHVGDMGNICTFDMDSHVAYYQTILDLPTVNGQQYNIIGRGLILHSLRDDGGSVYGSRLAQCVIGIGNPLTTNAPPVPASCCSDAICSSASEITSGGPMPGTSGDGSGSSSTTSVAPSTGGTNDDNNGSLTIIGSVLLAIVVIGIAFLIIFFFVRIRKTNNTDDRYRPFLDDTDQ